MLLSILECIGHTLHNRYLLGAKDFNSAKVEKACFIGFIATYSLYHPLYVLLSSTPHLIWASVLKLCSCQVWCVEDWLQNDSILYPSPAIHSLCNVTLPVSCTQILIGCTSALLCTVENVGNNVVPRAQKAFHASVFSCDQPTLAWLDCWLLVVSCPRRHLTKSTRHGKEAIQSSQPGHLMVDTCIPEITAPHPAQQNLPQWRVDSWGIILIHGSYFKSLGLVLQQWKTDKYDIVSFLKGMNVSAFSSNY